MEQHLDWLQDRQPRLPVDRLLFQFSWISLRLETLKQPVDARLQGDWVDQVLYPDYTRFLNAFMKNYFIYGSDRFSYHYEFTDCGFKSFRGRL